MVQRLDRSWRVSTPLRGSEVGFGIGELHRLCIPAWLQMRGNLYKDSCLSGGINFSAWPCAKRSGFRLLKLAVSRGVDLQQHLALFDLVMKSRRF